MNVVLLFSLILFYVLYGSTVVLQVLAQDSKDVLNPETDAFINQVISDWSSPGEVGVAVVRRDSRGKWNVETKGYGFATATGTKVDENTRFAIGSNSKLFTILATGLLISNETLSPRLSWTTKIASIIPIWGLMDPVATKEANILDLMSHRTGMPRHDTSYKWSDDVPGVIKKLRHLRPSAEFRDVWQYDNMMYMLLSYLPPLLLPSKTPFARYIKEHIFDPLGMTSTTYSYEVANSTGQLADGLTRQAVNVPGNASGQETVRVSPYWSTIGGEDGNVLSGAGGVVSSAVDMATWLQSLLLGGLKPGTNQSVIPRDAIQKVSTGISVISGAAQSPELSPAVYGGGQSRSTYRGHEVIEHDGSVPGFNSEIGRLPNDNIGVAVLTNDDAVGIYMALVIKYYLLDEALGLEKVNWNDRYKALTSRPPPAAGKRPVNASLPSVNITSLAGKYSNQGYGNFELCYVSSDMPTGSKSCKALASSAPVILPGVVNPNLPTFLGVWDNPFVSHIRLTHFNGNVFNVSGLTSYPTGNSSEPFWVYGDTPYDTGIYAEVVANGHNIGFGVTGIWGAGQGVPGPSGNTVRERSEVWFDRV